MKPLRLLPASVTVIGLLVAAGGGHAGQTPLVISTLSTAPRTG